MNRRGFLKRCSLLPFIGGLAAVGQSEAKYVCPSRAPNCPIHRSYNCSICRAKEVCEIDEEKQDDYITPEKEYQKVIIWLRQKDNLIELEFGKPEHAEIPGAREWQDESEDMLSKKMESYRSITLW